MPYLLTQLGSSLVCCAWWCHGETKSSICDANASKWCLCRQKTYSSSKEIPIVQTQTIYSYIDKKGISLRARCKAKTFVCRLDWFPRHVATRSAIWRKWRFRRAEKHPRRWSLWSHYIASSRKEALQDVERSVRCYHKAVDWILRGIKIPGANQNNRVRATSMFFEALVSRTLDHKLALWWSSFCRWAQYIAWSLASKHQREVRLALH